MSYELVTTNALGHFVYFDNNVYRLLKREECFWDNFFELFDKEDPSLLNDGIVIFSWAQILEDLNLGKIKSEVLQKIVGKKIFKARGVRAINKEFDEYWVSICNLVKLTPALQRIALMQAIDRSIGTAHSKAGLLLEGTLFKARVFIEKEDYLEDLACFLAWEIITASIFIQSKKQYQERNLYIDMLTTLWHKLFLEKKELNFYRLVERSYLAYVNHSSKNQSDPLGLTKKQLKPESDLCDGELIHFVSLGLNQVPVVAISFDESDILEKRLAIMKQSLIDHERDVDEWLVEPTPGKIISLAVDKIRKGIAGACLIPFNTPFRAG